MHGFQLWRIAVVAEMTAPRYQEVKAWTFRNQGRRRTHVRVVCGKFWERPARRRIAADPIYLDVSVPRRRKTLPIEITRHAFAYVSRRR